MVGSDVLTPRVRRLGILLVMAAIATALSGAAPAAAGGKPMPAATPTQRSAAAAADRQVTEVLAANTGSRRISATSVLLAPGVVMTVPGPVSADATMTVPTQNGGQIAVAAALPVNSCPSGWLCVWQHVYRNANQAGAVLRFYFCRTEYLQDLTRDRAADGGNWNDRIDQIAVC